MNCGERALSFDTWLDILRVQMTAGNGACAWALQMAQLSFDSDLTPGSINWMHNDSVVMTDGITFKKFELFDAFHDACTAVDVFSMMMHYNRSFAETVTATDAVAIVFKVGRQAADTVLTSDTFRITFRPGSLADTVTMTDTIAKHVSKSFADTVIVNDAAAVGGHRSVNDSIALADHGAIVDQSYFDTNTYFAADYFGYGYTW